MLKDLSHFNNFGTPNYFYQLLISLNNSPDADWKLNDLMQLFYNKVIDGRNVFDGCIPLALKIKLLYIKDEIVYFDKGISGFLNSKEQMTDKFIEYLFIALKNDEYFHNIFCSEHLSYDIIYKSLQIKNAAFGFKFSNFKQLLIDFGALQKHPVDNIYNLILNSRYKKLFDKTILPEIKKRKIGIDEFRKSLEKKQINGEEAEIFVLNFENKRLNNNKDIEWIAEFIVNEGYDIASYNLENDTEYNRFIEVKSYKGDIPYFFWSRNEVKVAKLKKDKYFLYLIDRERMNNNDYEPLIIQNPYTRILKNENWYADVDKWLVKLKT